MTFENRRPTAKRTRHLSAVALTAASLLVVLTSFARGGGSEQRVFATPEDAVRALIETARAGNMDELLAIFGPEGRDLVSSSDPATGRRNREVFVAAVAEGWRLVDRGTDTKELVIGNEGWPFPVPVVKDARGWRFDTAAGKEEILARRIGRNELAAIGVCQTYVKAQRAYAARGHDGKRAGLYARRFRSDPGTQNGLYWPVKRGERRAPLGDLVAQAAEEGRPIPEQQGPAPFHGYYFRILDGQGDAAVGGPSDYIINGEMSGGFALVAWPAQYDASGIMTFIVNQDGIVYEKDLGPETHATAGAIRRYDPDKTWRKAQPDAAGNP
jgi:Protein of unknown function (DUF2950)